MSVLVLGLNYRTAPVGLLDRLAVPADHQQKALASLLQRDHITEAVILSTCNRVEVYVRVSRFHPGIAEVRDFFCEWAGVAPEALAGATYDYFDDRAAAHLFAVTSGIESLVVGEQQIHLQVKQAFLEAEAEQAVGRVLQALFRQALRVAKRVRAETAVSAGAASMVDAGLDAVAQVLGPLDGRTVLVVGAGKMGGMATRRLRTRAHRVLVANRTEERAAALAERTGAQVLAFDDLHAGLARADLVLTSTGASEPVITSDDVERVMAGRGDRPLALLDLAVPRDVEPSCAGLPGVTVLDVETVAALTRSGAVGAEVEKARAITEQEAGAFLGWTRALRVEPTIAAMRARAEAIRVTETQRLAGRLGQLDAGQREAVESLTKGIVNTLLHTPSVRLKAIADARGGEDYAGALRELFDLPE